MLTQSYLVSMLERARALAAQGALVVSEELSNMLLNEELSAVDYTT
jgi:hypothetical protein